MNKIKQNKVNFILILITIILSFSSLTLLSLPVLFNYESKVAKIEKNFYQNFKIYLKISGKISYKPFPKPHLLVENAQISLNETKDNNLINTNNLKIYVSFKDMYTRSFKNFNSTEISNTNFEFKINNIKEIRDHLYKKINKPIIIKNCKIFLRNNSDEVIFISPINKISYKINEKNKQKNFIIDGNIFGINFKSNWFRNYMFPNISNHNLDLFKPNIEIENKLETKGNDNFEINTSIKYLQEKLRYKLIFENNNINISSPVSENINFLIDAYIKLNPFYSDGKIVIKNKRLETIIDYILVYLFIYNSEFLGNLSSNFKIKLEDINNKLINSGEINFEINQKKINVSDSFFNLDKIGNIKTKITYVEKEGDIIFKSKNILHVKNHIEFSRILQIGSSKTKNIKKIYFDLEKNIGSAEFTVSNVKINSAADVHNKDKKFIIKNIQNLRSNFRKVID